MRVWGEGGAPERGGGAESGGGEVATERRGMYASVRVLGKGELTGWAQKEIRRTLECSWEKKIDVA